MSKKEGLMISCKRATELVEIQHEKKLSFSQSFKLKLHFMLCKICDIYAQQSKKLNSMVEKFIRHQSNEIEKQDTNNLKKKIVSQLEKIED